MAGYNYNLRSATQIARNISQAEVIVPARVVDVILDNSHPEFEQYGQWASIGAIKYRILNRDINEENSQNLPIAFPLQSHIKHIPLKNEIVLIVSSPSELLDESSNNSKSYYLDIVNLWNHPHHNGFPDDTEQDIELGNEFIEVADINPMLPFEGDVILEGRFGNSLRFGSTNSGTKTVTKPGEITNTSRTLPAKILFNSGDSNPQGLQNQLALINSKVQVFRSNNADVKLTTIVRASESQVTNPNNIPPGGLAELRLEKSLEILSQFDLINQNIQSSAEIGTSPYTRGIDDPDNEKYLSEQFVEITVLVTGTQTGPSQQVTLPANIWSGNETPTGSPITVLSNGQVDTDQGYEYIVEDINQDFSSLYLTSNQKIALETSHQFTLANFEDSNIYGKSQLLGNSDRIRLNGRDSIIGTAENAIGFKAIDVYLEGTANVGINAPKIQLGEKKTQPILKGDDTVELLRDLLKELQSVGRLLTTASNSGGPVIQAVDAGFSLVERTSTLLSRLEPLKSKKSFTE